LKGKFLKSRTDFQSVTQTSVLVLVATILLTLTNTTYAAPIQTNHPAYGFWVIASKGPVTDKDCANKGGKVISKFDYIRNVDQGVGIIKTKPDGKNYLAVAYGDENMFGLVTVKQCGFDQ